MIYIRRVSGRSMEPTLSDGQVAIFTRRTSYQKNDIVLVHTTKDMVKRIRSIRVESVVRSGANSKESSVHTIDHSDLKGKLLRKT
ncbi:MAG: S24/S26 family peptidase [Patescibacteria group bacterium]